MIIPLNRFDDLKDTDLLACTDTDGVTYKVTGAQFKEVLDPKRPWDDVDVKYHVICDITNSVRVTGHDKIYEMSGKEYDNSSTYIGLNEFIVTGANTKFESSPKDFWLGHLTDTSKVTSMKGLFKYAYNFTGSNILNLDISSVTDMTDMFNGCTKFDADLSSWDISKVTKVVKMFAGCSSFKGIGVDAFDISNKTDLTEMFNGCKVLKADVSGWDVSNVENMRYLFGSCSEFTSDVSQWDVSNVIDLDSTFQGVIAFNSDLSGWDVSNVEQLYGTFSGCRDFTSDLSGWDVSNVVRMGYLFDGCTAFTTDIPSNISGWDVSNVQNMHSMFKNNPDFNLDISDWDVGKVIEMHSMFEGCTNFNGDISRWNTSRVEDFGRMFYSCSRFNRNLAHWYTARGKDFKEMFENCTDFTSDLSWWNTSQAILMDKMFKNAKAFDTNCSYWCVKYFEEPNLLNSNNPGEPKEFATGATNFTSTKPSWGKTCGQLKPGSPPPLPEPPPWEGWLKGFTEGHYYIEVIVTEELSCTVCNDYKMIWNADTQEEVTLSREATEKTEKNIDPSEADSRLARHIEKYKQSEEFLALSEDEQKALLEKSEGQAFCFYDEEVLPIGRYILGGSYRMSFRDSTGDFEVGPNSDFTKVGSLLYREMSPFSGASSFSNKGKPLPDWDMSKIYPRGLNNFLKETLVNDDLSHWCVPLHTTAGSLGTGQRGTDPVWGTCNGVESQPIADPFIDKAWDGWCYIGLQEHQDKNDYDSYYADWELEGPPGSPPTRGNCLFIKMIHDYGIGTHSDFSFMHSLSVGMYCKVAGVIYKITECGDANQWGSGYIGGAAGWIYMQLSGINGDPDPDFWSQWNTNPNWLSWQNPEDVYFDAWRETNPWKE